MNASKPLILPALLLALGSCDDPETASECACEEAVVEAAGAASPARQSPRVEDPLPASRQVAPQGRETFEEVAALIEEKYVDGGLSEDALWTAATEGVLARLIQLKGHPVNTLMSPAALEELMVHGKGKVVGVGVIIEKVAGVVVIKDTISGGPSEAAGLKAGDRILGIDGERVGDLEIMDIAAKIRGEKGSTVELFVQRDTEEWTETIERNSFEVPSVESHMITDGVAIVRINNFAERTAEEVAEHLERLGKEGMQGVVLDLRRCPGGYLNSSIETADEFLAPGKVVVSIRSKDGVEEQKLTDRSTPWESIPLAVVVGPKTASGAEIVAAALGENGRAQVIGEQTMGKGTVESIHELSNGWALKLSISRFYSPNGENRQSVGLKPSIVVPGGEGGLWNPLPKLVLADDPQLATAVDLVEAHAG